MKRPLRAYQWKAVERYLAGARYLAAEQGLGKTLMAIEIAWQLKARKILYLCPASVKISIVSELKKWAPASKFHLPTVERDVGTFRAYDGAPLWTIVNYDKISRSPGMVRALVAAGPYDLLVLDEAHLLKTPTTARTKAVFDKLAPAAKRVLPMSGTPMPNHAGELYAPLRALAPEMLRHPKHDRMLTHIEFEDQYCQIDLRYIGGPRPVRTIKGSRNIAELKKRIDGFFIRMTKAECLPELPPLQFVTLPVSIGSADELKEMTDLLPPDASDEEVMALLRSGDEHFARALRMIGVAKAHAAVAYLREFMLDNDAKIVLWARHHDVIDLLMRELRDAGAVKIDGRCTDVERQNAIDAFLTKPAARVFIGQINAAGTGLTLLNEHVQPRDVFFVESDFVPGNNLQAACRVHRIGAHDGVLARMFVAQGVRLDMRVQEIINRKLEEIGELI